MKKQDICDRKTIKGADTVSDILSSRLYLTFKPNDSIEHIVKQMHKYHQGAIGVTDDKRNLIGIITEHDILRKIFGTHGESNEAYNKRQHKLSVYPGELVAKDVIVKNPVYLTSNMKIEDALDIIKEYGFRFMPVVNKEDRQKLIGIVSERELFWYTQEKIQRALKQRDTCLSYFLGCEPYGLCEIPANYSHINKQQ